MTCLWCDKVEARNSLGLCQSCIIDLQRPGLLGPYRIQALIDKVKREGRYDEAKQWHREWKGRNSRERVLKDLSQ